MMDDKLFAKGRELVASLRHSDHTAYFAGGAVRDMLLGNKPSDIDIATSAKPEQISEIFPRNHQVGASFGVVTVILDDAQFEVATFREERDYLDGRHPGKIFYTDKPELDARRRDFTINGMFYDPINDEILDFVGGAEDLHSGVLRCIGDPRERFSEDFLRILRAIRFVTRFDFSLDNRTQDAIRELSEKLRLLSVERVRDEITKMLIGPYPSKSLRLMSKLGVLAVSLPEIEAMNGVTQPKKHHPEGDVFEHVAIMLDHLTLADENLAWSVLLHDVGKPATLSFDSEGVEHFYRHERFGSELAEEFLKRFKFSRKNIKIIVAAIQNHMRFASVHNMRPATLKRLMAEPSFALELELHRIDCLSCHKKMDNFLILLDKVKSMANKIVLPPALLSGRDLMDLGLSPGPNFGVILKRIRNAQLDGCLEHKEQALDLVRKEFLDTKPFRTGSKS